MLVLLKKAVVELDEMRGGELLEKEGLLLHLQLHVVCDVLAHEDAL